MGGHQGAGLQSRSRYQSWSRSESTVLAGVGVGAEFGIIYADSNQELHSTSLQQTIILAERLSTFPKALKDRMKGERPCVYKIETPFDDRIPSERVLQKNLFCTVPHKFIFYRITVVM